MTVHDMFDILSSFWSELKSYGIGSWRSSIEICLLVIIGLLMAVNIEQQGSMSQLISCGIS